MTGVSELHRRYAAALYALFQDGAALRAAAAPLLSSAPLAGALKSPCVSRAEKEAVLARVLPPEAAPALAGFFRLLCQNGRMDLLPGILEAYHALDLAAHNAAGAEMACAFPPAPEQLASVSRALAARRGLDRVELSVRLDPALLGGFVVRIGGETFDASVQGALHALGRTLAGG